VSAPVLWPVARLRQFAGGAWIIAAGLAVGGTFAPLLEQHIRTYSVEISAWGAAADNGPVPDFPDFGIPVVIGAVILVAAALLAMTSTRLHPASGAVLAARLLGTGATGITIGCTVTLYLLVTLFRQSSGDLSGDQAVQTGLGAWLLIAASVVGVVGSILVLVPKVEQRLEPETPPMGIPVVRVLEPEFDEPGPDEKG
jgi:hypothetical protein